MKRNKLEILTAAAVLTTEKAQSKSVLLAIY